MKYKNLTTEEDEKNKIYRYEMIAENWEENKLLAKGMGIEIDKPNYIECTCRKRCSNTSSPLPQANNRPRNNRR